LIASNILWEAFSPQKDLRVVLVSFVICSSFSKVLFTFPIIFGLVPVRVFAPSCMASVHSVFLREVMHGVFSQNAAFFTSFSVS